jgi:tetratricopeptide (TPR) repeat protein
LERRSLTINGGFTSSRRLLLALLTLASAAMLLSGCRSLPAGNTTQSNPAGNMPGEQDGDPTLLDTEQVLPLQHRDFSKALAHYGQGLIHDLHDDTAQAATNYVRAFEIDPDIDEAYLRASKRYVALSRNSDALAVIQRLIDRRSDDATPELWKAVMHQAFENHEEAIASYRAAIKKNPSAIAPYLEVAGIYYKQEDYREAIEILERAIKQASHPAEAYRYLADLYRKRSTAATTPSETAKYRRKAIQTLAKAVSADTADNTVHWHLGKLLVQQGEFADGLAHYITIDQNDPDNLPLKEKLAESLKDAVGTLPATIDKLTAYLVKHPDNGYAQHYLGFLQEENGNPIAARNAYTKAIAALPDQSSAYWKAALLWIEDDLSETRKLLEQGHHLLPEDARILEMLAFVYLQEKSYAPSVEKFKLVDTILSDKGINQLAEKFHYNFSLAAQGASELDLASEHLMTALELNLDLLGGFAIHVIKLENPEALREGLRTLRAVSLKLVEPEIHYYISLLSKYSELYGAALSSFTYTESLATGHVREAEILDSHFYFSFASTSEQANDFHRAEQLFLKCVTLDPTHAQAHNYLAYMWSEQNIQLNQAMRHIDIALKLEPTNGAFLDTRGWIYYQQGRYKKALKDLRQAHEIIPDDPTILDHLGDTHMKLNKVEEAKVFWRNALNIQPDNRSIAEKLRNADEPALQNP